MTTRRNFLKGLIGSVLAAGATAHAGGRLDDEERPNFIFIITDDISPEDLGCYGNGAIKTPHIDSLARSGVRFTNAYLSISSCSPSRCSIITGRYPHNTGAAELHTTLPGDQLRFPELLRKAGYYTALSGKNHMGDVAGAFDLITKGKGPGREGDWVDIVRGRPADKPFFFWFASSDAHRGWKESENVPKYDPAAVTVPPYLYDGAATRKDLADYYHEVSRTDFYLGALIDELDAQGLSENTYVIYCSDNGRPFPRCKTRLYDSGIKTPLIVSGPGIEGGRVADGLVSAVDFAPTFLSLAGAAVDKHIQGVSFAPLLDDPAAAVRDCVFAEHNWHVFQAHERMVRHGDWVYIRNAWPERQNLCVEGAHTPSMPAARELWEMEAAGKLIPAQRDIFQVPRPAEELYNVAEDPHQLENLADEGSHEKRLDFLRALLDRWIDETGDTVPQNPTADRQDARGNRVAGHVRGTMPGAERKATAINERGPVLVGRAEGFDAEDSRP